MTENAHTSHTEGVATSGHQPERTPTAIDAVAEEWVTTLAELEPRLAVWIGGMPDSGGYGDLSPAGADAYAEAARKTIAALDALPPADTVDAVTKADLRDSLALDLEEREAGLHLRDVNVIASPAQEIRDVFDLMPTSTVDDWEIVATRLGNVAGAVDGYIESLREGIRRGIVPAKRQVREVFEQAKKLADSDGFFAGLAANASPDTGQLPASLASALSGRAGEAAVAYQGLADFFAHELEPVAGEKDAIGRELYAIQSRKFLGATIDLDETYEWGIEELARMVAEQESIADQIKPGAGVLEAIEFLDGDASRKLHGTDALRSWMQETSDHAVSELGKTHFDVPDEIRRLECMIAPTQEGGIYYTGPSDDFSRPGRMWWSVPEGVEEFDTWRELTTVYHEGIPGHHLQIGQAVYNRALLNTWRRQLAGTSGHAEGWALYAERLMEELGYLDDPADRLGMLDGQRMRAARVVLDIGVHLEKPLPDGSGVWTAEHAFEFMGRNVNMNAGFVRFEVNRYLGWPGQAPSYKVGQRIWEQIRDESKAREGDAFDMKAFHKRALDLGGLGLDTLRRTLLG